MDHSYSTERERLQRSDHSYFTVGKKTPQVVLRKAQHMREHSLEMVKTSIGQDHSYVRADHAAQPISFSSDGLEALIEAITYRELQADLFSGTQHHSVAMEIHDAESYQSVSTSCATNADDARQLHSGCTLSVDGPVSVTCHRSDLDDLRCLIGCFQLDHAYDGHMFNSSSSSDAVQQTSQLPVHCSDPTDTRSNSSCGTSDRQCRNKQTDAKNCWTGLLDHAYERSSWDTGERSHWDHAYNIQCVTDNSSSVTRSASRLHLDHSYDCRMVSELSHSETVLSLALDHAYFAPERLSSSGRRYAGGQRWSSSDDLRRTLPAFV